MNESSDDRFIVLKKTTMTLASRVCLNNKLFCAGKEAIIAITFSELKNKKSLNEKSVIVKF